MRSFALLTLGVVFLTTGCTVVDFGSSDPTPVPTGSLVNTPQAGGNQNILLSITGESLRKYWSDRISQRLDARDRDHVDLATNRSLTTGDAQEWENTETGNHGRITPGGTFKRTSGRVCRDFIHTFWRDGDRRKVDGTACQIENGSWEATG